jgi:type I restriction enzyme, S subunit
VRAQWAIRPLGELCDILDSKRKPITKKDRTSGEFPYYGATGILDYVEDYIFDEKLILIGEDGAKWGAGENTAFAAEGKYWVNNHAHVIRPHRDIVLDEWIVYHLNANDLSPFITGLTVPKLNQAKLRDIPIPLPPLPEQKRIVAVLDEAFEGISAALANAEKNLANARELFEGYLQHTFAQHGAEWKMMKLDELTELARGHNPPKSKFSQEAKPGYIRFYQIRDGSTDDYAVYVPDTPQLHKMKTDDIMMVAYRHVGRAFRGVEGAFNVALCKISNARRDLLDDDYLFHLIPSQFVRGELLKRSERSLIPSMSIEHLREIKIPLPPLSEQQRMVKKISLLSADTTRLEAIYQQKLADLAELKQSILQKAFAGELTARPEQVLQEAVA